MKLNNKYILASASIVIVGAIVYFLSDIVSYIVLAWVLSMIGAPVMSFLRKFMGKSMAAISTLALFVVLMLMLVWTFIPPLVHQAKNLSNIDYDKVKSSLDEPIQDWENWLINKGLLPELVIDTLTSEDKAKKDLIYRNTIILDSLVKSEVDSQSFTHNVVVHLEIDASKLVEKQANADKIKPQEFQSDDFFSRIKTNLLQYINPSKIQDFFSGLMSMFGNIMIGLMSVFFIAFFFLREQGLFLDAIKSIVPNEYEEGTTVALEETSTLLIRYFVGILVQMTIITLFVSISLKVLGIPNSLLIGFFAAIMNVIPYIGPLLGAALGIIITISSGLDLSFYNELLPSIFKVMGVFFVMQMTDNFILQPNIFSKSVKAHPLEIFIVVLIGAKLGGILGMVLAIPAYTVLRVVAKVFLSEFKVVQRLTKNL